MVEAVEWYSTGRDDRLLSEIVVLERDGWSILTDTERGYVAGNSPLIWSGSRWRMGDSVRGEGEEG